MSRNILTTIGILALLAMACGVMAATYNVLPEDLASGKPEFSAPHGTGTNPFGYDWDSAAPLTAAGAPAGLGNSSFYASVTQGAPTAAEKYRSVRVGLRALFGRQVALGQVASLSFYTNKPAPQTAIDWRLTVYTTWQGDGLDKSSWYRNRIQSHTTAALNLDAPASQWNLWATGTGTNQLQFFTNRTGFTVENILWSELAGGDVTRGASTWNFAGEEIMMLDIMLGADTGGGTGESQIDGVRIELTTGEVALVDLGGVDIWVDDDFNSSTPGWGSTAFATIQGGVDAAAAGGTVGVLAGTYTEQVEITKNLLVKGVGDRSEITIVSPAVLTKSFTTSAANKPVVYVHDAADVTILNLTVDGNGMGNSNYRFCGVAYWNAGGAVKCCDVKNVQDTPFSGAQHGIGIYSYVTNGIAKTLEVSDCTLRDVQKTSIAISGVNNTGIVIGNTVIGEGPTSVTAQNGIQVGYGANGTVSGNYVTGFWYSGSNWGATGILLYSQNAVDLSYNTVCSCQNGINSNFPGAVFVAGNNNIVGNEWGFYNYKDTGSLFAADASSNWWGNESGPMALDNYYGLGDFCYEYNEVTDTYDVVDWAPALPAPATSNNLYLAVTDGSIYVQPGEPVVMDLRQSRLATEVMGYQAFLSFDTSALSYVSTAFTPSPYATFVYSDGSTVHPVNDGANINLMGGADFLSGTMANKVDAGLATITFTAAAEGTTRVAFRQAEPPTMFTDDLGNPVAATTIGSANVYIDGTAPIDVTISADPVSWTPANIVTLTFSANDAFTGIDHYELQVDSDPFFQAESTYDLNVAGLADGQHTVTVKAFDMAGNTATASTTIYLDKTAPTVAIDSAVQGATQLLGTTANAIQGTVTITVSAGDATSGLVPPPAVTVTDSLGNPMTLSAASGTGPWTYECTVAAGTANGAATITADISDVAGNPATQAVGHFNVNKTQATIDVTYESVAIGATRTIKFIFGGASSTGQQATYTKAVTFTSNPMPVVITNLSNNATWTKVSVKDEKHTLRKVVDLGVDGDKQYSASASLTGGDLTNDNWIDILDFGVFAGQYGTKYHPPYAGRDADIDGNGQVNTSDFTYISNHFLTTGDAQVGMAIAMATGPKKSAPVAQLALYVGLAAAKQADMNADNIIDTKDVTLFVAKNMARRR